MRDATHLSVLSPDRRVEVRFLLGEWCADGRKHAGMPLWQVWFGGKPILRWSLVGDVATSIRLARPLALQPGTSPQGESGTGGAPASAPGGLEIVRVTRHRIRRTWQPERGDAAELRDHANELVVRLQRPPEAPSSASVSGRLGEASLPADAGSQGRAGPPACPPKPWQRRDPPQLELIFRCADEGAAVRVRVPRQRGVKEVVAGGACGVLRLPEATLACATAGEKIPVDELKSSCTLPLLLNFAHGKIAVATTTDGSGRVLPTRDGLAVQGEATPATAKLPYVSPWQVVLLGDSPCAVMQHCAWLQSLNHSQGRARPADAPSSAAASELAVARLHCGGSLLRQGFGGQAGGPALPFLLPTGEVATPAHRAALALVQGEGAVRWDETRWLRGAFGEFAVVARRLGGVWQVAGITGAEGRVLTVRLEDVLGNRVDTTDRAHRTYSLEILRDPLPGEPAAGGLVQETFAAVDASDKPRLELRPHGGFVLRLEPEA
jgi:hypothetical protein